ncbi:ATP-binding cassette domain-containing protein [Anaerobiospirillum thomasii]|uniref:Probable ATP-binding protein YheS n=2 Tax=Gammaproteobacteria TaxID=1236 RepID=A0A2X0VCE8_9GAMM|nr:ATP-binding cassette domain-containing protein [Anaerobiospirillum thomasii]SPT70555.1 Uncharacterized ABC transporter ATP-binding protein YheS [Anaerobiospirillum thomasii]
MISLNDLTLMRGSRTLIEGASATIYPKHKVGIIGSNGCGKSTLFEAIKGNLSPEKGSINVPKNLRISSVAQQTPSLEREAIEYVIDGDQVLRSLQKEKEQAYALGDGEKIALIEDNLGIAGAWTINSRAASLMHGLGFAQNELKKSVRDFSGGWRMRLNLAQALIAPSDLLLLDEPTNHLDLDTILFLESYLKGYNGTLLCISHDRDFLDSFCSDILHFENSRVVMYTGNYSDYERLRAERIKAEKATRKKEEQILAHMQSFVDRFRYKASKSKQAQSLLKAIDKMQLTAVTQEESPFSFSFAKPERTVDVIATIDNLDAGYDTNVVLKDISLELFAGDRIGLLGKNGQGKSTFIKTLCSQLEPLKGTVTLGRGIKIGYFAQHELESLNENETALWHIQRLDPKASERDIRSFLGSFAFSQEKALSPVKTMSGGEQARLALAVIAYQKPNLLLLDEPTNHLDLKTREALSVALSAYDGALVLVSHDRHLLEVIADKLWLIDNGSISEFNGDLDDYKEYLSKSHKAYTDSLKEKDEAKTAPSLSASSHKSKEQKREMAMFRAALKPYKDKIAKIEKQMDKLKNAISELDDKMADESFYAQSKDIIEQSLKQRSDLSLELEQCEMDYLESLEELEAIETRGYI